MDMRKCDVCGESYSSTYRRCPFCEEEEALRRGKPVHRRAKDYRNRRGGHAIGVLVLLAVFVVAGLSVGRFFGDRIADAIGIRQTLPPEDPDPSQTDPDPNAGGNQEDPTTPADPDPAVDEPPADPTPETPVALSSADFTLNKPGDTEQLTVSGGGGDYTWKSDNAAVATVTPEGLVTATGSGNANVSVTDGYTTAVCIVRVRGQDAPATGTVKLNRSDMTMPAGTTFQLKVSGTSSAVTWSIEDTSIATISGDGTVSFLKKGKTTATAAVDGKTLTCIVRVS